MDMYFLELLNGSNSLFLDRFAVAFTTGYTWIPLYVALAVLVVRNNKTMGQIMIIFACVFLGVLASGLLSDYIVKPYVMRPRPCYDLEFKHLVHTVSGYSASGYSFFTHSMVVAECLDSSVSWCALVYRRDSRTCLGSRRGRSCISPLFQACTAC